MKRDLVKQEEVVSILWAFLEANHYRNHDVRKVLSDGTRVVPGNQKAIGKALEDILAIFGYERVEIQ